MEPVTGNVVISVVDALTYVVLSKAAKLVPEGQIIVSTECTWDVQVLRYPIFFSGMEADRNVKVVGGDVAVL